MRIHLSGYAQVVDVHALLGRGGGDGKRGKRSDVRETSFAATNQNVCVMSVCVNDMTWTRRRMLDEVTADVDERR